MTIKVITFDLDNTLWDVEPVLRRAEAAQNTWLREYRPGALDNLDADKLWDLKKTLWREHTHLAHSVTAMRRLFLRALQINAGYSADEADAGSEAAFDAFLEERQRVELYADVIETLETLARDFRLGALTNGNADIYKTDAGPFFEFAFLAEHVGASKPAPALFHAALDHTGAAPDEVLHVGDNPDHDIRGALAAGLRAAWVNPGSEPPDTDLQPDATVRHVRELPEAIAELQARIASGLI